MLDLINSQITYSSRYLVGVALAPVRDMALLDPFNPRSVVFQVNRIDEGIATLPVLRRDGILEEPHRLTTSLCADLATERAEMLDDRGDPGDRAASAGAGERDCGAILPAGRRARPRRKDYGSRVNYNVTHVTRYTYRATVELTTGVLRLKPVSRYGQTLERFALRTDPPCLPPVERDRCFRQCRAQPQDREDRTAN